MDFSDFWRRAKGVDKKASTLNLNPRKRHTMQINDDDGSKHNTKSGLNRINKEYARRVRQIAISGFVHENFEGETLRFLIFNSLGDSVMLE